MQWQRYSEVRGQPSLPIRRRQTCAKGSETGSQATLTSVPIGVYGYTRAASA